MTKPYHITQEEALELAKNLQSRRFMITVSEEAFVDFHDAEELAAFANAVLDKVLGEPVAWAEAGREHNVIANLVKQTNKNDWVRPYTVALYAPRREK